MNSQNFKMGDFNDEFEHLDQIETPVAKGGSDLPTSALIARQLFADIIMQPTPSEMAAFPGPADLNGTDYKSEGGDDAKPAAVNDGPNVQRPNLKRQGELDESVSNKAARSGKAMDNDMIQKIYREAYINTAEVFLAERIKVDDRIGEIVKQICDLAKENGVIKERVAMMVVQRIRAMGP